MGHADESGTAATARSRPAVVVIGSHLAGTRRRLVAEAERVANDLGSDLVVFSGWSASGGSSEAELMRALWRGEGPVELVLEETARTTVENAARTAPMLLERGVTEAVVVCAPTHLVRARWIFRTIYADHGIEVRFRVTRELPTPGALLWELGAWTVARRQLRRAHAKEGA
jgi:uncharacterized SAM-binding protein YcdF (DUF218 family)